MHSEDCLSHSKTCSISCFTIQTLLRIRVGSVLDAASKPQLSQFFRTGLNVILEQRIVSCMSLPCSCNEDLVCARNFDQFHFCSVPGARTCKVFRKLLVRMLSQRFFSRCDLQEKNNSSRYNVGAAFQSKVLVAVPARNLASARCWRVVVFWKQSTV